jgi:hypothetical protein
MKKRLTHSYRRAHSFNSMSTEDQIIQPQEVGEIDIPPPQYESMQPKWTQDDQLWPDPDNQCLPRGGEESAGFYFAEPLSGSASLDNCFSDTELLPGWIPPFSQRMSR